MTPSLSGFSHALRGYALVAALLAAIAVAPRAAAQDEAGADAARAVIASQLEAFSRDDWAQAFTFASPAIRRIFGTPERFGEMVRNGYPMVWRPARVEFVEAIGAPPALEHRVLFTDGAGRLWVARYSMVRDEGGVWKINGVQIEEQTGV